MKEFTIKVRTRDFWISLVLGMYAAMGAFISLSREATIDNSPDINLTSSIMLYTRTMYRSFSANRLRSFLFALIVGLFIYLALQIKRSYKERVAELLFSILFASGQLVAMIFKKWGGWYAMMEVMEEIGVAEIQKYRIFMKWSSYVLICYFLVAVMLHFFHKFAEQEIRITTYGKRIHPAVQILMMALCMFVAWLPYFVYFYPGTSNEDTVIMLMEYNEIPSYIQSMSAVQGEDIFITNHHPYILTILFSWFVKLGQHFGDAALGVACYVLIQMMLLALVYAGGLYYIHACGVTRKRMIGTLLLFMFIPVFPMYAICMLKDTFYATFCLIFMLMMHYVARSKGQAFRNVWFTISFFFVACMMILTKVYAMYILLIVGAVYLIKYRQQFVQIIASVMLPVVLYKFVFCGMLLPALNVAPGGLQEALSVPFQQTARYVTEYGDEVTAAEKKAINQILPYKKLAKKYNPELSDPVKKYYNQEATKQDLKAYFKVWRKMFWKHPEVYVESILHNTYQYYDINKISSLVYYKFNDYLQLHDDEGQYSDLYIENKEEYLEQRYAINQLVLFTEKVPIVNVFASIGLWPWLFLFALLYNLKWKKKDEQALILIPLITIAICMVSPDNGNTRYVMPLLYILPFLIPLELLPASSDNKETTVLEQNALEKDV